MKTLPKLNKKQGMIAGGVLAVLAVGGIAYFATQSNVPPPAPPAPTAAEQLAAAKARLHTAQPVQKPSAQQAKTHPAAQDDEAKADALVDALAQTGGGLDGPAPAGTAPSAAVTPSPKVEQTVPPEPPAMPAPVNKKVKEAIKIPSEKAVAVHENVVKAITGHTPEELAEAAANPAPMNETSPNSSGAPPAPPVQKEPKEPEPDAGAVAAKQAMAIAQDYSSYYDYVAMLHRQQRIMEVKKEIATLEAGITDANKKSDKNMSETGSMRTGDVITRYPRPATPARPSNDSVIDSITVPSSSAVPTGSNAPPKGPRLVSVMMVGGRYEAEIAMSGGDQSISVTEGAALRGGWRVQRITPTSVVLARKGKSKTIDFED